MRKLCWWALPCSAAIFLSVCFFSCPRSLWVGVFCGLGGLLALLLRRASRRRRVALAAFGLAFGFLWTGLYGLLFRAPAQALADRGTEEHDLVVADFPRETDRGASLLVQIENGERPHAKVRLYADRDALPLRPGDRISARVRLAPSDQLHGETVDYYSSQGIYLLGYAQDSLTLRERPQAVSPRYYPQYAAHAVKSVLTRCFPQDVSGFLIALLSGDKSFLPQGLYSAFQRAGLSHVVAVSGLHIGFLVGLLTTLLGARSRLSAALGVPLIFFFVLMVGCTPSALRAAVMAALLMLAPRVGREDDPPTTLSAALLVLLLPCPYAVTSVSLQLSFGAVAGIYLISGPLVTRWASAIPKWDKPVGKALRRLLFLLCSGLAVTLGALLFTAPLSALYFHSLSLAGPLSNLLTMWAVSASFLGGLVCAGLGIVSLPLGSLLAWVIAWPARWVMGVARCLAGLPFSALPLSGPVMVVWFVASYLILLVWLLGRKGIRPPIPIAAWLLTLCAALAVHTWSLSAGTLTVAALDVGQGASTLFRSQGHCVLVDCGGNGGEDPGDVAADYLQSMGLSRLDALILTHYHSDHACGVPELLSRVPVSRILLPDVTPEEDLRREILTLAREYGCQVEFVSSDTQYTFGQARFTLFAPLGDGGANEEGLSVLCSVGHYDALITGDMNSVVEKILVRHKDLPDIELLMVGHHGSKSSTSEELLLAVRPEIAVISSGYNSYGHPAPETLERLGAAGCDIYLTRWMGTVHFTITTTKEDQP